MTSGFDSFAPAMLACSKCIKGLIFAIGVASAWLMSGCTDKLPTPITSVFFGEKGDTSRPVLLGTHVEFSRFTIVKDDNGDGTINPGETSYLLIYLKNTGSDNANSVKATFTTTSSYVTSLSPAAPISYGKISAGGEAYGSYGTVTGNDGKYGDPYTFKFTLSNLTPIGSKIGFFISISDDKDSTWTDSLSVTVEQTAAHVQLSRYSVVVDDNKDGKINPGEVGYLLVYLKNTGTSQANSVHAAFASASNFVSGIYPTASVSFGTMSAGSESEGDYTTVSGNDGRYDSYTFRFTLSSSTPSGTSLTFNVNITDAQNNKWTDSLKVTVVKTGADIRFSRCSIVLDDNKDGKINPGEECYLLVYLKNTGTSQANGVHATFRSTSSYVSGLYPTASVDYGTMLAGNESEGDYSGVYGNDGRYSNYTFKFTLSSAAPAGTPLTFYVSMSDDQNNKWVDSLRVTVVATAANVQFSRYSVVLDDNKDGNINPGETGYLLVYLKNSGTSQANSVKATITSTSSYVSGIYPTIAASFGTILPGCESEGDYSGVYGNDGRSTHYTFSFDVSSSTPLGTSLVFSVNMTDAQNNKWTDTLTVTVVKTGANVQSSRYTVVLDDNKDGNINPGETGYLLVYLKNTGTSQANDVKATFASTNSYVSGMYPTTSVNFGTMSVGGESEGDYSGVTGNDGGYASYTFKFTLSSSTPAGSAISFTVNIADAQNNRWSDNLVVSVK